MMPKSTKYLRKEQQDALTLGASLIYDRILELTSDEASPGIAKAIDELKYHFAVIQDIRKDIDTELKEVANAIQVHST